MGAIAGIIYPSSFLSGRHVDKMLDIMSHRSKKKRSLVHSKQAEFGIFGGPIFELKEKYVVGIDGKITNSIELTHHLEKEGIVLKTGTQEEIVAHLFALYEKKALERLSGDFSLFIFDKRSESLYLARDRIGKKPLYWHHKNNTFIFASELKGILATGLVAQAPSNTALATYLYFGYFPQDLSPIQEVNKLLPGYIYTFKKEGKTTIDSYFSLSSLFVNKDRSLKRSVAHLEEEIQAATMRLCMEGSRFGCSVLGGLGSCSIAYYLKKAAGERPVTLYSTGFTDENEEDIQIASLAADTLHLKQFVSTVEKRELPSLLPLVLWHLDEPIADPFVLATYKLAELASQHHETSLFSGMGSDELFAGHSRYSSKEVQFGYKEKLFHSLRVGMERLLLPFFYKVYPPVAYNMLRRSRVNAWQAAFLRKSALFNETLLKEVSPELASCFNAEVFLNRFENLEHISSNVEAYLYLDVKTRLSDAYMHQFERMMSAFSLSWKTPFLEQKVIEAFASLPEPDEIDVEETARYLKELVQDKFPKEIIDRKKVTRKNYFEKFAYDEAIFRSLSLLKEGTLVETGLISERWLSNALSSSQQAAKHFSHLYALLTLELWFALYINNPHPSKPDGQTIETLITGR